MAFVQTAMGVLQHMQMFDQPIAWVAIQWGLTQQRSHRHQGLGIGHTAFDLFARTPGAVAQLFGGAELNGFHVGGDANPIHTPTPGAFPLAIMAPPSHTGPLA